MYNELVLGANIMRRYAEPRLLSESELSRLARPYNRLTALAAMFGRTFERLWSPRSRESLWRAGAAPAQ